jgi:hypothetical protein
MCILQSLSYQRYINDIIRRFGWNPDLFTGNYIHSVGPQKVRFLGRIRSEWTRKNPDFLPKLRCSGSEKIRSDKIRISKIRSVNITMLFYSFLYSWRLQSSLRSKIDVGTYLALAKKNPLLLIIVLEIINTFYLSCLQFYIPSFPPSFGLLSSHYFVFYTDLSFLVSSYWKWLETCRCIYNWLQNSLALECI